MGKGRHKVYSKKEESKEAVLRKKIKELEKEIIRLKSELKTLNKAFEKTGKYIKDNTDGFTVERVIEAVKKEKKLVEIKQDIPSCPKCKGSVKESRIPAGLLRLCEEACGYREVVRNEKEES